MTGDSLSRLYDYERAIRYFMKAIEIDAEYADAYNDLRFCYLQLKDYNNAYEAYKKCLELEPTYPRAANRIVRAIIGLGRLDELREYVANPPRELWADTKRRAAANIGRRLF